MSTPVPEVRTPGRQVADVSVVVPAHNAARTIRAALLSALRQTLPPAEILVVDDASTDSTARVVESVAAEHPSVRLLRLPVNGGVSVARSTAIAAADRTWVALLDADDEWLPRKLERQLAFAAGRPELSMIGGYYQELFGDDRPGMVRSELWWQSACLIKRSVFDDVPFDPAWTVSELPEFFSRFDGRFERDGLHEVVMRYRMNTTGLAHRSFLTERRAWTLIAENSVRRGQGRTVVPFGDLGRWYRHAVPPLRRARNAVQWRGDWLLRGALIETSRRHWVRAGLYGLSGIALNPRAIVAKAGRLQSLRGA